MSDDNTPAPTSMRELAEVMLDAGMLLYSREELEEMKKEKEKEKEN